MMTKYALLLAVVLVLAVIVTWAFLPARHLPGNRARHLRIGLHLRLQRQPAERPDHEQAGEVEEHECPGQKPKPDAMYELWHATHRVPCHPRQVMTQTWPADNLAVCVNQQTNRVQACST